MKKKYNLALLPTSKSDEFVNFSRNFSKIADQYLLGKKSFPHVTLHQFETDENKIDSIWRKICTQWSNESIRLDLSKFSYITFDKNIYWISLIPKETTLLHKMHALIANIAELPINKNYDPHLTLINTKINNYQNEIAQISKFFSPITDKFTLTLGKSDIIGQYTEIIYTISNALCHH